MHWVHLACTLSANEVLNCLVFSTDVIYNTYMNLISFKKDNN